MLLGATAVLVSTSTAAAAPTPPGTVPTQAAAAVTFPDGLPASEALTMGSAASLSSPVIMAFRSGKWTGLARLTSPTETKSLAGWLRTSKAAQGPRPLVKVTGSPAAIASVKRLHPSARSASATSPQASGGTYTYDPATAGCTVSTSSAGDYPPNPPGWTPNPPSMGHFEQFRQQGAVERMTHNFFGMGNDNGQYPCKRRAVDATQGQGFVVTSRYAYEHDFKIANCPAYVKTTGEYMTTDLPLAYLDTRASDSSCSVDFTVGTVAPFLLRKGTTYHIDIQGDAAAAASTARATLVASILNVNGVGCKINEYPRGVLTDQGNPWCVNVAPPFTSVSDTVLIKSPNFVVRFDGTCYNWTTGRGYVWCGVGRDPNT